MFELSSGNIRSTGVQYVLGKVGILQDSYSLERCFNTSVGKEFEHGIRQVLRVESHVDQVGEKLEFIRKFGITTYQLRLLGGNENKTLVGPCRFLIWYQNESILNSHHARFKCRAR